MEWLLLIVVAIGGILFVTARKAWLEGQQEAAANLIARAERMSGWLMTKEAQDAFKTDLRRAADIELRQGLMEGMRTEIELENAEKVWLARNDTEMLASTRVDLQQVRVRLGWVRDECAARGMTV
jgi:hypothetical protein